MTGHIVQAGAHGKIHHYDIAGYVVISPSLLTDWLLWKVQRGLAAPAAVRT